MCTLKSEEKHLGIRIKYYSKETWLLNVCFTCDSLMYTSHVMADTERQGPMFWKIFTNVWRVLQGTGAHSRAYITSKNETENTYIYTHIHIHLHIHTYTYIDIEIHRHIQKYTYIHIQI